LGGILVITLLIELVFLLPKMNYSEKAYQKGLKAREKSAGWIRLWSFLLAILTITLAGEFYFIYWKKEETRRVLQMSNENQTIVKPTKIRIGGRDVDFNLHPPAPSKLTPAPRTTTTRPEEKRSAEPLQPNPYSDIDFSDIVPQVPPANPPTPTVSERVWAIYEWNPPASFLVGGIIAILLALLIDKMIDKKLGKKRPLKDLFGSMPDEDIEQLIGDLSPEARARILKKLQEK